MSDATARFRHSTGRLEITSICDRGGHHRVGGPQRAGSGRGRGRPVRGQEQPELLRHRARDVHAAVLHHQAGRIAGNRRPDRPGGQRHLSRAGHGEQLWRTRVADRVQRRAWRQRDGQRPGQRLQAGRQELRHHPGLHGGQHLELRLLRLQLVEQRDRQRQHRLEHDQLRDLQQVLVECHHQRQHRQRHPEPRDLRLALVEQRDRQRQPGERDHRLRVLGQQLVGRHRQRQHHLEHQQLRAPRRHLVERHRERQRRQLRRPARGGPHQVRHQADGHDQLAGLRERLPRQQQRRDLPRRHHHRGARHRQRGLRQRPWLLVRGYTNTVDRNISHDNEDSGFQFYTGSHDNLVVDNLSYGNGDHGIDDLGSTNQRIISNTVYDNVAAGINVEGSSTGATIENNIAVDNGINSPRTSGNIRVDSTSTTGTTVNYNLVFLSVPDVMYQWGSDKYDSLQAFRAATGMESHGDQDDPSWVSAASGDFHLLAGSPAIDSADSAVSGETST